MIDIIMHDYGVAYVGPGFNYGLGNVIGSGYGYGNYG